ncbi:uncharacterized protein LOC131321424 isoform X1 [Rhododendron vialii]|uniref:uncharacterized protein LOC131321424 isoform X1 n=2 Tax=Rhododendron vialii TaxID=182163 RepID=UPI00265D97FE|nr:uncharacterized protein LOC131321424 isoform X1 [Rhododendron vialii]
MEECDELTMTDVATMPPTTNPSPNLTRNSPSRTREEGELSSSEDDFSGTTAAKEEPVPVEGNKAGRCNSTGNPKSIGHIPSKPSVHPNSEKITEKNRATFVPFVISFSDDDSGSESGEFRQSKVSEAKGSAQGVDGNRRPPSSSMLKSQMVHQTPKNEGSSMPKKAALSLTFVSSMTKINGPRNGGRSLVEQRSHVRNFNTLNKKLAAQENGGNHNIHLNTSKLQDLRQQIAIREKEIKLKSAQQSKETVSGSSRDYNVTDLGYEASKKCRVASAIPFENRDPDKKRQKLSEPNPSQLISDVLQQQPHVQSDVLSEKRVAENAGQHGINEHCHRDEGTSLGTMLSGEAKQRMQGVTHCPLSSGERSTDVKGADVIINGSHCDQNTKLVDPSISLKQTGMIGNDIAKTFSKKSLQSTMDLKHSSELNCHLSRISDKANCGGNLIGEGELHEIRSAEKAFRPSSNNKQQASSLCVPAGNVETSDVPLGNTSAYGCLGTLSISQGDDMDMQSLLDVEELHDKELEEAQEHRHKCEIEERNALKAYRNAQRALVEANARCSYLYRKRELYSSHFRSLMLEDPSLFQSSNLHNRGWTGLDFSNGMLEDHIHQLPTSNHRMQAEFNDYNQQGHPSNVKTADGSLQIVSDQYNMGQHLASDPSSEPDSSTSEPHEHERMADGVCSPSSDLNESADEEDEKTFRLNHKSLHSGLNSQGKEESDGQWAKHGNNEAKRKFPHDSSQDSLLLEETLRSQLFARLGTKALSKKRGPAHNTKPAVVSGVEHGGAAEQAEMNSEDVPFPVVEKSQQSGYGGAHGEEKIISELSIQMNMGYVENFSSNYASPAADPLDSYFSTEGDQSSRSVTFSCPILRSTYGHLKVTGQIRLVGLQCQRIGNYDISNEESNSVGSTEITSSILSSSSGKVGCYTSTLAIDPFWPLCMFDLRGKCNNDECPWQHVKDFSCELENSDNADCQVGSSNHRGKLHGSANTSKGNDCQDLAPPAYLVCLEMLKGDFHTYGSVLAQSGGQCWKKCFSSSMVLSSLLPPDSPTNEPFLHGTEARIEVHRSWNGQSLFHSINGAMNQVDQCFADNEKSLETALLILNQEVNKRKGRTEALIVLARALEVNPSCVVLWVVYLHVYYSTETSIGKDDMFLFAVEQNEGSYELWLLYINSRVQHEDRLVAYDTALLALCRCASTTESDAIHASAVILDLFLQLVNFLCISGNVGKAIEKICGLFSCTKNSEDSHPLLLSNILPFLTLYDKCIFWLCCVYFIVYRKLPDVIVQQLECEKELFEIEWPSVHLTVEEKQQAVTLSEMAVDSLALCIDNQSLESGSTLKAAHMFAVNHIRCIAVLEGLECSRNLMDKYTKLYPSCLELVLMSGRTWEGNFGDLSFAGFEEALSNWPEEVPGVQCIWNQYAEFALQNHKFKFARELMSRWFHSVWQLQNSPYEVDSMGGENSLGSLVSASALDIDAWICNSSGRDVVFGLLNLSLHKLFQNEPIEARLAIDRALKVVSTEDYKHCVKEHALFLLAKGSQLKEEIPSGELSNILKSYVIDVRTSFTTAKPLTREFIENIRKPRVRQLVSNIWSPMSSNISLVNLVLEVWNGPSLLPNTFSKLKDMVDFVEAVMEILPSNYQLAISVCKLLSERSDAADMSSSSVSFWGSSLLANALFRAVPVAAEYVWVEAAAVLRNLTEIQSISESFHRRALSLYPFSVNLWKSYLDLSLVSGNSTSVMEAARERGIKLELTL